ncbi:MAG: transglutaminase-like domain-containing protein, partial [Candidatus Nealsonbacteria bacterium]|nr:transglutaminase-like domain-containing protein [Candidatus Nealsonbacteria bacterium]
FERLTQPNEEIKKIADGLRGKTEQQTLENVLFFLEENLKHIDLERENPKEWKKLFNKRAVEEILENKISYGCNDTATAFTTLMRSCGIPIKYIEGKRIGKSGTHDWGEVFVDGEWKSVDPTQGREGLKFDPKKVKHGPYIKISESLGPSDSMITSYEDWIRLEKLWDYKKNILKN